MAASLMALFGWGWLKGIGAWFRHQAEVRQGTKLEQELKAEGIIKADGTVTVDNDFDAELNDETKEMDTAAAELEKELNDLEAQSQ